MVRPPFSLSRLSPPQEALTKAAWHGVVATTLAPDIRVDLACSRLLQKEAPSNLRQLLLTLGA